LGGSKDPLNKGDTMRGVKAKLLNKELGKKERRRFIKDKQMSNLISISPKEKEVTSKKRHKNETLIDFRLRRREANKRKRLRRKLRHATRTRSNKLSGTRS